jgi:hypothetical protein
MSLPPVPADVVHFNIGVDVNGYPCSYGFWLLVPGASGAGEPYIRGLLSDYFLTATHELLQCMHSGASLDVLRADAGGPSPARAFISAPENSGAWEGGQAQSLATVLYVTSSSGGRGSGSRIRIPAVPDIFIANNQSINRSGYGHLILAATELTNWVNAIVPPGGGNAVIGTLQRKTKSGPLAVAAFDPAAIVKASPTLAHLDNRLLQSRHLSPTP